VLERLLGKRVIRAEDQRHVGAFGGLLLLRERRARRGVQDMDAGVPLPRVDTGATAAGLPPSSVTQSWKSSYLNS
jgi:hypothetical protein